MPSPDPEARGVVLSGCCLLDGAEIYEATLTLLFLDRKGAKVTAVAPAVDQMHVVDHLVGEPVPGDRRGVLAESARIARGQIVDMAKVRTDDLDPRRLRGGQEAGGGGPGDGLTGASPGAKASAC